MSCNAVKHRWTNTYNFEIKMESAASALEKMDGTEFERICGPILKKLVPELKNFIPSGLNAAGKSIQSLADGFCFISNKHLATVHITTNASDLYRKWLYDGDALSTPKGDLIKGINQAISLKADDPEFRFSIYLISSHRVDERIHFKVQQQNTYSFIQVKIIEQRDLVYFLDNDGEGQYLRHRLLQIDAERLSEPLLREIVKENLQDYGRENFFRETSLVNLSRKRKVKEDIDLSQTTINLLVGESGYGKSAICFLLMKDVIDRGSLAFRIRPSIILQSRSVDEAIYLQITADNPGIYTQPHDVQVFFKEAFVVIDDINKSENSVAILEKIIAWNKVRKFSDVTIVCPVWPKNLDALDNKQQKKKEFTVIPFGRFSFDDCKAIILQRFAGGLLRLTEQKIHLLIVDTGFDPLLLDFSLELISDKNLYTEKVPTEAINSFVSDKIKQINYLHLIPVYLSNNSLQMVGTAMLKSRKLDPHVTDIENWLGVGSEAFKIVILLAAQRQLLYFDDNGICLFRHDRVRDYLLSRAASNLLADFSSNQDVLTDPYYAEIIGSAIGNITIQKETLEKLIHENPLSVYTSLKYVRSEYSRSGRNVIIEVIKDWLTNESVLIPKSVAIAISSVLITFDVEEIDIITKGFPDSLELQLAKFRNGKWLSGVNFFSFIKYFYPEAPTYWWNVVFSHVKVIYFKEVFEGLRSFLPERFTENGIIHAYTLAGFFKEASLMDALSASWKKYASPKSYVPYLWAVLNCFIKEDRRTIEEALNYWSILSEQEKNESRDKLLERSLKDQIRFIDWNFSEEKFEVLVDLSNNSNLFEILSLLFAHIDHPAAFAVVLSIEMLRDENTIWYDRWDNRWDRPERAHRLSDASLDYLIKQFTNRENFPQRRYLAWRYWTGNADPGIVLEKLKEIRDEKDSLFDSSVLWRVKHRDESAAPALFHIISFKPWLVRLLDNIWNEEVKIFFSQWFAKSIIDKNIEHISLGLELLSLLENDDACELLIKHWEDCKWHVESIETALFLSSPETTALADLEIRRLGFAPGYPMPDFYYGNLRGLYISEGDGLSEEEKSNFLLLAERFKSFHLRYGANYKGKKERITRKKLEILFPYLSLIDNFSVYEFAVDCLRIGEIKLCVEKFYPLLDTNLRSKLCLTETDIKIRLIEKYQELEREKEVYLDDLIETFRNRKVANEMLNNALNSFIEEYNNQNAFFITASVLAELGIRKNIPIMERFSFISEENAKKMEYWKSNTIFVIKRRILS